MVEYRPLRRCGNTTRIIDEAIQNLFDTGECKVVDHYYIKKLGKDIQGLRRIFMIIESRLKYEHRMISGINYKVDLNKASIQLIK